MRWLIIGPYPPSLDPAAAVTRDAVADRIAAGDEVVVVSPAPSAAHETGAFAGADGLLRLARRVRTVEGLWIRLGDGIGPTPHSGRARALLERALLGAALRLPDEVVVDVGDLDAFPGGRAGKFVFDSGARFVADDVAARALVERGCRPDLVSVRPAVGDRPTPRRQVPAPATTAPASARHAVPPAPPVPAGLGRESLERWIRDRAASVAD